MGMSDKKLLQPTDSAAKQIKQNRATLVWDAVRAQLWQLNVRSLEERDRAGYATRPATGDESILWEAQAVWPEK